MNKTSLPVIVLRNIILFPHSEIRLEIDSDKEKELLSLAESYYDKHILIVHQLDVLEANIDINMLPKIGIVGYIEMKIDMPNQKTRVVIKGLNRVEADNYEQDEDGFIKTFVTPICLEKLSKEEEIAYSRSLIKQLEYYINKNSNMSNSVLSTISNMTDMNKLTDVVSAFLPGSYERKLEYIEEIDPTSRITMLIEDINQELKIVNLEKEIEEKVGQNLDKAQRDYLLQEKLKVIKDELNISFDKDNEIESLKKQIDDLNCNNKIKERLNLELKRYEITPSTSPEIGIIRNYIDWLLKLPWNNKTTDNTELKIVRKSLDKTHYGLEEVKDRVIEYLALETYKKGNSPIICLIGPPGVGKTSFAKSIALAMGRNYAKISVGGVNDEAEIIGHRRAYIGSSPGRIVQGLKKASSNNPVFVIDEIDKMCKDIKGDPTSSLLEVLDKEQNSTFYDNYIEEEIDLSHVMFICTANYEFQIPKELLDRLEVIKIDGYTECEKLNIAKDYIIPKSISNHGLKKTRVKFTDKAILKIIRNYTKESGIRELERQINTILRKIVSEIVVDKSKKNYIIIEEDVLRYLKREKYLNTSNNYNSHIGVVNALSYTIYGGDVLPIEVSFFPGKGEINVTGSLGDIFKESIKISISYIKSNSKKFKINYDLLKLNDIHVHVPEGAIKKDGPSAGCAVTTAIISSLKNKEIPDNISMTGEITLHGNILPIGGLKEKIIGAKRNNINKIFVPKENEKDIEILKDDVKENVDFIFVSNYEDIFKELKL